jgi:protein translocase SecG subunit
LISFLLMFAAGPKAATPAPSPIVTLPPQNFQFQQATWGSQHLVVLYIVQVLFVIVVIGLIGLMSIQTTKTEGLSGSIGGRMESAYKGRLGMEQQLARLTSGFAIAFMFLAILDFLITR